MMHKINAILLRRHLGCHKPLFFFSKTTQSFKFKPKLFKDIWKLNKYDLAFLTWFCFLFLLTFLFIHKDILCTKHEKIQIKPNEIYSNCLDAFHFISVHFIFGPWQLIRQELGKKLSFIFPNHVLHLNSWSWLTKTKQ